MKKKLDEHNRIMAIARCLEFIQDIEKINKLFTEKINKTNPSEVKKLEMELCNKWKVYILPIPFMSARHDYFKAVMMRSDPITVLTENEWAHYNLFSTVAQLSYVPAFVDLTKSNKQLLRAFRDKLKEWRKLSPPIEKQKKKTEYDPWEIYDMYIKDKNFSKIARKLSGEKGTPAKNDKLKLAYKKVKNAYSAACQMITQVQPKHS